MTAELVFGALARRLEVRSGRTRAGELQLRFRTEALAPEELALLASVPGLALVERGAATRLRGPLEGLEGIQTPFPALGILLQAHRNAVARRSRPRIMGILNVTPDSFSDGGRLGDARDALQYGLKLAAEGADILDVGGESTRPGAAPVSEAEEIRRVLPVIEELAGSTSARISVDTTKSEVARLALEAGATMVNDVSAGRMDPHMLQLVAEHGADIVLMHMQGSPRHMQDAPHYDNVVGEVTEHLRERVAAGLNVGIAAPRIAIDPGIGFGKRLKDNLDLLNGLPELRTLGVPIVLGVSRKSFLGKLATSGSDRETAPAPAVPRARGPETLAAVALGHSLGADIHRVHDVAQVRSALDVADALVRAEEGEV